MSEKSVIYLSVARTAKERGYYDLSSEYYELYAQEMGTHHRFGYTLEHISIAVQASLRHPNEKIPAIKELRDRTNFGLREAKDLIEVVRGEYRGDK